MTPELRLQAVVLLHERGSKHVGSFEFPVLKPQVLAVTAVRRKEVETTLAKYQGANAVAFNVLGQTVRELRWTLAMVVALGSSFAIYVLYIK